MLVTFDFNQLAQSFGEQVYALFSYIDFNKYIAEAGMLVASEATKIGGFGVNVLLALLLSLLLLLEKKEIAAFGEKRAKWLLSMSISFILGRVLCGLLVRS